ncbi:hypothetical protein ACXZ1K_06480 [Pedobacter sp. PWIIR3]
MPEHTTDFQYFEELLKRLDNNAPYDSEREHELVEFHTESEKNMLLMRAALDPFALLLEINRKKFRICTLLLKALELFKRVDQLNLVNQPTGTHRWALMVKKVVIKLEHLYQFTVEVGDDPFLEKMQ